MVSTRSTTERVLCSDLPTTTPGETVRLQGWVHRRRELSALTFLVVRDRSGLAQVVIRDGSPVPPEETTVEVVGVATANSQAPGGMEVTEPVITALTEPAATPPAELWRPSLDVSLPTLLDHAPVMWRHPAQRARWELAAASVRGFRATLDAAGFTEIQTPKFVASATESGANVFEVDYFGRPAYLAQSPQFYKQQLVGVFERVYEVGPVFRAEPHDTVRHLAEYVSLDVELGFIRDHHDVLAMLREVLAGMVAAVHEHAGAAVERAGAEVPVVPEEIPVSTSATRSLWSAHPRTSPTSHPSTSGPSGRGRWPSTAATSSPSRATRWRNGRSTHPWPGDETSSNSFDLLFRGLELVTGGQRLHRPSAYDAAIRARDEDPATYATYLQAFEHGMPPHGGFAIGLERWTARLTGAANIREVTLFPRDLTRLTP